MQSILGVDIGGVIIDRVNRSDNASFYGENYLNTPAVPDAFITLKRLTGKPFGGRVHLVSKCGPVVQAKTLVWMDYHDFSGITGITTDNFHFCLEWHEKAGICKKLGITHFVDDRLEVLMHLIGIVPYLYLFCPRVDEVVPFRQFLPMVQTVNKWSEVEAELA